MVDAWAKVDNKNARALDEAARKAYRDRVIVEVPDYSTIRVTFKDQAQVGDLPDTVLAKIDIASSSPR